MDYQTVDTHACTGPLIANIHHKQLKTELAAIRGIALHSDTFRVWRKWAYVTNKTWYTGFDRIRLIAVAKHLAHGGVFQDFDFAMVMAKLIDAHNKYAANYQ